MMILIKRNFWDYQKDRAILTIFTSGEFGKFEVNSLLRQPISKEASNIFVGLISNIDKQNRKGGLPSKVWNNPEIVTIPFTVCGQTDFDFDTLYSSLQYLVAAANNLEWRKIAIPEPCFSEITFEKFFGEFKNLLDDRFHIVRHKDPSIKRARARYTYRRRKAK